MDPERGKANRTDISFSSVKDRIKEKANHPTISGTLILFLILDVIMLIVGSAKKHDCPVEERIPIFLIVAGTVGIVSKVLPFVNRKFELSILSFVIYFLYVFEFVWMVIGSVWVYSIYQPQYSNIVSSYCDKTTYLFAFWLLTIRWVLLGLSILCICCFCCIMASKG